MLALVLKDLNKFICQEHGMINLSRNPPNKINHLTF